VNYAARRDAAWAVVEEIRKSGGAALPVQADVADPVQVAAMIRQASEGLGRVDVLVNNAGLFRAGQVGSLDDDILDSLVAVNVKGVVHCTQAVIPRACSRGGAARSSTSPP
jgi:3-oxoacyl-[acyl-carrier protein] reductase